jgi:hypothetical protein
MKTMGDVGTLPLSLSARQGEASFRGWVKCIISELKEALVMVYKIGLSLRISQTTSIQFNSHIVSMQ